MGKRGGALSNSARITRAESKLRHAIAEHRAVLAAADRKLERARDEAMRHGVGAGRVAEIARGEGVGE